MGTRICILGAGPGGYAAAVRAAQGGAEVTLVEKEKRMAAWRRRSALRPFWKTRLPKTAKR